MISIIQKVKKSSVKVDGKMISQINNGYNILVGIFEEDTLEDVEKTVKKLVNLRIILDENKKMNKSIKDTKEQILLISQFTLCANLKGGRRPSFIKAMEPKKAKIIYEKMVELIRQENIEVQMGSFGDYMEVEIVNDGPTTIILDSKKI